MAWYEGIKDVPFETYFGIEPTIQFIVQNSFQHVALQLPDSLLQFAERIVKLIRTSVELKRLKVELFVLADTSYGSCCVDEVGAQHAAQVDAIVHYGHACLSQTRRLPVLYVFGHKALDIHETARALHEYVENLSTSDTQKHGIVVAYELEYEHAMSDVLHALKALPLSNKIIISTVQTQPMSKANDQPINESLCGFSYELPLTHSSADYDHAFIGSSESPTLMTMMLNRPSSKFVNYNPLQPLPSLQNVSRSVSRILSRRYYLVEKAKNADIFGIVVATLGVGEYLSVIAHMQKLISDARKKSYLFVVGKINEPKLSNFQEIDLYVLVACPMNSLIDSSGYHRDVITPFELDMALTGRSWTGDYSTDFHSILHSPNNEPIQEEGNDEVEYGIRFDPITGKLRESLQSIKLSAEETNKAVALRSANELQVIDSISVANNGIRTSSDVRSERQLWTGLGHERRLQSSEIQDSNNNFAQIEEGLSGIASKYESEKVADP